MNLASRPFSAARSIFSRKARSPRHRGVRRREAFMSQFNCGQEAVGHGAIHLLGCDALEQRIVLTASPAADFDFSQGIITGYHGGGGDVELPTSINGVPVVAIGDGAFLDNDAATAPITRVVIPNGVISIGADAFKGCTGLTNITVGRNLIAIGTGAFQNDSSLTTIALPNSVTSIGVLAFQNATGLESVTIGTGVGNNGGAVIGDGAFAGCTGLKTVKLGTSVGSIGDYAFYLCASLAEVTFGKYLSTIGKSAFYQDASLASVVFTGNAPSVGSDAFQDVAPGAKAYRAAGVTGYGNDGDDFHGLIVALPER